MLYERLLRKQKLKGLAEDVLILVQFDVQFIIINFTIKTGKSTFQVKTTNLYKKRKKDCTHVHKNVVRKKKKRRKKEKKKEND